MGIGSAFISIFPGPIRFDEDYNYTIYYVRTKVFNHGIFTANKAFTEVRYSLGFTYNKESKKVMLVSPDMSLNDNTEDQTHVLDSGMLTQEQAEKLNNLVYEFSEGVFKTKQEMNIFYGVDSKKRDYSLFENNCTSVLSSIFPNNSFKAGSIPSSMKASNEILLLDISHTISRAPSVVTFNVNIFIFWIPEINSWVNLPA